MRGSRDKLSRPRAATGTVIALIPVWLVSVCGSASAADRGIPNGRLAFDRVRNGDRNISIDAPTADGNRIAYPERPGWPLGHLCDGPLQRR